MRAQPETAYVFTPGVSGAGGVQLTAYGGIESEKLLGIWNATRGGLVYSPNMEGFGGTVSGNEVTLLADTSAMSNTDKLVIFYEGTWESDLLQAIIQGSDASVAMQAILGTINGKLPAALVGGKLSVTDPSALPLPAGASTLAKQDAMLAVLADLLAELLALLSRLPNPLGQATKTRSLGVTLASDDALLDLVGAVNESTPAGDGTASGLNGGLKRIAARLSTLITNLGTWAFGSGTAAAAHRVTLASDDPAVTLLGTKVTSITALETGGVGIIGWLSQIWRAIKSEVSLAAGTAVIGKVSIDQTTPGTTNAVEVIKVPKASAVANRTTVSAAATALAANSSRKNWHIQNLGLGPLCVKLGASASTSDFDFVLQACTANDDGKGGSFWDDSYTGIVTVASSATVRYSSYEV